MIEYALPRKNVNRTAAGRRDRRRLEDVPKPSAASKRESETLTMWLWFDLIEQARNSWP